MFFPSRLMEAIWVFFLLVQFAGPAPVQDSIVRLGRLPRMQGCYFKSDHFENGERIFTQESCLNCTCIDSTVMCYLRVCPFVKPLGEHCIEVKNEDDCCPTFHCPEVAKEKDCHDSTHNHDQPGCFLNGTHYPDGAMLPPDPKNPCEVCYCIRNSTSCVVQECELKIEGCSPIYKPGQCCPCRYNCSYGFDSTTVPPGYTVEDLSDGCMLADERYIPDGEAVNSSNPCEHCYCMRNEVVCAIQECQAPGDNCKPLPIKQGQCCPDQYDCPSSNESSDSSIPSTSNISTIDKVNLPKISKEASAIRPEEVDLESDDSNIDNESVEVTKHTETGESDYKITPEVVSKDIESATEVTQTNFSVEDVSKDDEITTEVTHTKVSDEDIPKHDKMDAEITQPNISAEDVSTKYEKTTEVTQSNVSFENTPEDDKASIDVRPSIASSEDILKDAETFIMENPLTTNVASHSEEAIPIKETATKAPDSVKLSPKGIIRKITPSEKSDSDKEKPKFGQKGGFEEIPLYKPTPPPNMVNDYFPVSRTKDAPKSTTMSPPLPPLVYNPYKLPNSILRIRGQNTTKVFPGVTAIFEHPRPSQGIKGGVFNITIPTGAYQGVKGYSFKAGVVYPNRHKPILPVGAIPGEDQQGSSVKLPGLSTIPGEGNCQVGKITYRSGHKVPSNEPCKTNCHCIHGVVYCDRVICAPPPERNCVIYHFNRECCPHYQCDNASTTLESVSATEVEKSQDEQPTETPLLEDTKTLHTEPDRDSDATTLEPVSATEVEKSQDEQPTETPLLEDTKTLHTEPDRDSDATTLEPVSATEVEKSQDEQPTEMPLLEDTKTLHTEPDSDSDATTLEPVSATEVEKSQDKQPTETPLFLDTKTLHTEPDRDSDATTLEPVSATEVEKSQDEQPTETPLLEDTKTLHTEPDRDSDATTLEPVSATEVEKSQDEQPTETPFLEDTKTLHTEPDRDSDATTLEPVSATEVEKSQDEQPTETPLLEDTKTLHTEPDRDSDATTLEPVSATEVEKSQDEQPTETPLLEDTKTLHTEPDRDSDATTLEPVSATEVEKSQDEQPTETPLLEDTKTLHTEPDRDSDATTLEPVSATEVENSQDEQHTETPFLEDTKTLHTEPDRDSDATTLGSDITKTTEIHEKSAPAIDTTEAKDSNMKETADFESSTLPDDSVMKEHVQFTTKSGLSSETTFDKSPGDKITTQTSLEESDINLFTTNISIESLSAVALETTAISSEKEENLTAKTTIATPLITTAEKTLESSASSTEVKEKTTLLNDYVTEDGIPSADFDTDAFTDATVIYPSKVDQSKNLSSTPDIIIENTTILDDKMRNDTEIISSLSTAATILSGEDSKESTPGPEDLSDKNALSSDIQLKDYELKVTQIDSETEKTHFENTNFTISSGLQESDTYTITNETAILTSENVEHAGDTKEVPKESSPLPGFTNEVTTPSHDIETSKDTYSMHTVASNIPITKLNDSEELSGTSSMLMKETTTPGDISTEYFSLKTTSGILKVSSPVKDSEKIFEPITTQKTGLHDEDKNYFHIMATPSIPITTMPAEISKISTLPTTMKDPEKETTLFDKTTLSPAVEYGDSESAFDYKTPAVIPEKTEYEVVGSDEAHTTISQDTTTQETIKILDGNEIKEHTVIIASPEKSTSMQSQGNEDSPLPLIFVEDKNEKTNVNENEYLTPSKSTSITEMPLTEAEEPNKVTAIPTVNLENITVVHDKDNIFEETMFISSEKSPSTEDSDWLHTSTNKTLASGNAELSEDEPIITHEPFRFTGVTKSALEYTQEKEPADFDLEKNATIPNMLISIQPTSDDLSLIPSVTEEKGTTTYSTGDVDLFFTTVEGSESSSTVDAGSIENQSTVHTTINDGTTYLNQEDVSDADETTPSSSISKVTTAEVPKTTLPSISSTESFEKISTVHTTINEGTTFLHQEDVSDNDEALQSSTISEITTVEFPKMTSPVPGSEEFSETSTVFTTINKETILSHQDDVSATDETIPSLSHSKITTAEIPNMTSTGTSSAESSKNLSTVQTTINEGTTALKDESLSYGDKTMSSTIVSKFTTDDVPKITSPASSLSESSEKLSTVHTTINEGTTFLHDEDLSHIDKTIPYSTVLKITTGELPEETSTGAGSAESSETLSTIHTTINEGKIMLHQDDVSIIDEIIPSTVSKSTTVEIPKMISPTNNSEEASEQLSTVHTTINEGTTLLHEQDASDGDETITSSTVSKITTAEVPNMTSTVTHAAESTEKLSPAHTSINQGTTFLPQEDASDFDQTIPSTTVSKITTVEIPKTISTGTGSEEVSEKLSTVLTTINERTTFLDQEDVSNIDETMPSSTLSKITTPEFHEMTSPRTGSAEFSENLSTVHTTIKDGTTFLHQDDVTDGGETRLSSTDLKFTTDEIPKISSLVTDSAESSEKLQTTLTALNERTTFLHQKDSSEILEFDNKTSEAIPATDDSVDATEMSSDSIYEKEFTQKMTTNETKTEVIDHQNVEEVSSIPNVTTTFVTHTETSNVPDASLETEKSDMPSSVMTGSPEQLVFTEAKTTQHPQNIVSTSMQTTFQSETSSQYLQEIPTTSIPSFDHNMSEHGLNVQHPENQEAHTTTFSNINETEQNILPSLDKNISYFNYTSTTVDNNENITITAPQTDFAGSYSEITSTEDNFPTTNTFLSSENISVLTTHTPDIISRTKPQHLSENTLDKDIISTIPDTKVQTTVVSAELDTGTSAEKLSENNDTKIKTQTSKYPLLISGEIHEYEMNGIKDQSLIGHKIKDVEKEISSVLEDNHTMEGISQMHQASSIPHVPQNITHTTIQEFSDTKSESLITVSSPIPNDVSRHEFSTTFIASEETAKTPLTSEITTTTKDSSFYDFLTHEDTSIERETLPQLTMQSPESLVSHSESLQEKLSTAVSSPIKVNISTPIDMETSVPSTFPTTDQESVKSIMLDPRNLTTDNMDLLEKTAFPTLSSHKGLEKQTSTTDLSGLKVQPEYSGLEFLSYTTTEKSQVSTVESTQGIDLPETIITKMPIEILESEAKLPEAVEINTPDIDNKQIPSSTSSHSINESDQHYLPTTIDNVFESSKTGSIEDSETGVKSKSSLPYPDFTINKSDISTAKPEFTEEPTIAKETLDTGGSTKGIHYETETESISSSQYPEFIVNKSDTSIGKPQSTEEPTIYEETLATDGSTKGIHNETEVESTPSSLYPEYIVNKSDISTEKPGFLEESTKPKEIVATDGTTKGIYYETGVESTSSSSPYPEYIINKFGISTGNPEITEESTIAKETLTTDGSTKDIHYEAEVESTQSSSPYLEFVVNKSDISTGKLEFTEDSTLTKETLATEGSTKIIPLATGGTTKDFHTETGIESRTSSPYPEYIMNKSDISTEKPEIIEESTISKETISTDGSTKEDHSETGVELTSSSSPYPEYIMNKSDISTGKPGIIEESTISKETISTDGSTKEYHSETEVELTSSSSPYPEYIMNKSDISNGKSGITEEPTIYEETLDTDGSTKEVHYETEVEATSSSSPYPEYMMNKSDISTGKPGITEEPTIYEETLDTDRSTKEVHYETEVESTTSSHYPEYMVKKYDISTEKPGFTEESTISKETLSTDGLTKEVHYETEIKSTSSSPYPEYIINMDGSTKTVPLAADVTTKDFHSETEVESTPLSPYPEYIVNKSDISTKKTGFTEESTISEKTLATGESTESIQYETGVKSITLSPYPESKANESHVSTRKSGFTEDSTKPTEIIATDADVVNEVFVSPAVSLSFDSNNATESFSTDKQSESIIVNQTGQSLSTEGINFETTDITSYAKTEKIPSSTTANHSGFTEDSHLIHFTGGNMFDTTTTSEYTESTTVKTEEQPSTVPDLTTFITQTSLHDVTTQKPSDLTMKYITTTADYFSSTKGIVKDTTITPHTDKYQSITEELITNKPENLTVVDMTTSPIIHNVGVKLGSNDVFDILTDINKDYQIVNDHFTSIKDSIIIDDSTSNTDDTAMLKNVSEITVTSLSTDEMHTRPSTNLQTEFSDIPGTEFNIAHSPTFETDTETNQTNESSYLTLTWLPENKSSTSTSILTESQEKKATHFSTNVDYSTTSTPPSNIVHVSLTSDDSYSEEIQNVSSTDIFKEDNLTKSTEPLSDLYSTQDKNVSDAELISLDHQSTLTADLVTATSAVIHDGNLTEELQIFTTISPENIIYNITTMRENELNTSITQTTTLKKTEDKSSFLPDLTTFIAPTDFAEQTTHPNMEEIDFNATTITTEDQTPNDDKNATEIGFFEIHSIPTSVSSKDATKDLEINSTPISVGSKDATKDFEIDSKPTSGSSKDATKDFEIDNTSTSVSSKDATKDFEIDSTPTSDSSKDATKDFEIDTAPTSVSSKNATKDLEIDSTPTSVGSKDATKHFEIQSTSSTAIPKDQIFDENENITSDLIKKTSMIPENDIKDDNQTVNDFFTSTMYDERIPVTSEKFDHDKSNHSALSGASAGWMTHPLEDDIVKALSTIFPSNPDTMIYETHSSFPTGTAVYGTHTNQGSGVCYFEGKIYLSSEQIPREDNCEFCFCFKGDIICLQQTCPPPISGCYSIPIDGFCCPRFHCPVQQMWFGLPSSTTTTTTQPLGKSPHRQYPTPGCQIEGKSYRLHQIVQRSSNPCMLCRCDYGGIMKCEPRSCKPGAPMIQEIAEAFFRRR